MDACYRSCVEKTWYIEVVSKKEGQVYRTAGTGFSLYDGRMVCTAAHLVKTAVNIGTCISCIVGYLLTEDDVARPLEIALYKPKCGIALLRVCSEDAPPPQSFKIADYAKLFVGQSLIHISNGGMLGGSLYKCNIACDLPKVDDFNRENDDTNLETKDMPPETYLKKMKLGHILPIIELSGLHVMDECSGGPVVNLDGDLVGMLIGGSDRRNVSFAVHGAVISQAYKECHRTCCPDRSEP